MTGEPWQNPFAEYENSWRFHAYDNFINGGLLYQTIAPGEAQYSEWSQQMVSTMYQNWYNSAPEQMKRAIAAGINPFVAASGIVGTDPSSVAPSPNSAENTLPQMVNSLGSAVGSLASGFGTSASAYIGLRKLRHEIFNIDADTANTFETLGFTKLQSKAMSIQLKYLDEKEQIGVWHALANYVKTSQEYLNLVQQHQNMIADYNKIIAEKDLLIAEKGEVLALEQVHQAQKALLQAQADWQDKENKFFEAHGYKLGSPIFESIRDMMVSNGTFNLEAFGNNVSSYEGKIATAKESAHAAATWNTRPSNAVEMAAWASNNIVNGSTWWQKLLKNPAVSQKEAYQQVKNNQEFLDDYHEVRNELYSIYKQKKRAYNKLKHGGNTQEVAKRKQEMDNAYKEYKEYTTEKFLCDQLSQLQQNFLNNE